MTLWYAVLLRFDRPYVRPQTGPSDAASPGSIPNCLVSTSWKNSETENWFVSMFLPIRNLYLVGTTCRCTSKADPPPLSHTEQHWPLYLCMGRPCLYTLHSKGHESNMRGRQVSMERHQTRFDACTCLMAIWATTTRKQQHCFCTVPEMTTWGSKSGGGCCYRTIG